MMTTRRAMPPSLSAREREVLVVGRSYAPALLGWCSAMRSSLTWNPRSSSATLGTSDCWTSHPGGWLAILKQLLCQTLLLPLRKQPGIYTRGRRGEVSKCVGSSRIRQAATPYLRIRGSRSHSESRRDRSKSDTRERRACGSPRVRARLRETPRTFPMQRYYHEALASAMPPSAKAYHSTPPFGR